LLMSDVNIKLVKQLQDNIKCVVFLSYFVHSNHFFFSSSELYPRFKCNALQHETASHYEPT
jgi:hypothetical protein